jgi:hypothetical protein
VNKAAANHSPQATPDDIGTLWTVRRFGRQARCALMSWPEGWELRIVVDSDILLAQRCGRGSKAFSLAEEWRNRMLAQGWDPTVPRSTSVAGSQAVFRRT